LLEPEGGTAADAGAEERKPSTPGRKASKRTYESGSESAGDDSDASESKTEARAKRQPKPTYKKKQNDMAKRRGDNDKDEDDVKPNGVFRSAREKTKLKLASSSKSRLSLYTQPVQVLQSEYQWYILARNSALNELLGP
jgi:jumonji domain-containing protein 1C